MGCDIHGPYIEYFDETSNRWWLAATMEFPRFYFLFALMVDVRNEFELVPVSKPKGLPPDLSTAVNLQSLCNFEDHHSHSWMTLEELKTVKKRFESERKKHFINGGVLELDLAIELMQSLKSKGFKSRAVMWFDN